ncbi:ferritin-like domain-containing protein [Hymenobacter arizonensis]|uniref:Ferritin-like domain-containing protein n=1 Tax=Hymenobacter arizonensis TaxID=1227077 RepID=A0A1I5WHP7_HYMAR|nr:ferritin-like domain-containing protein [Hymenobacter arizonensis]SFQ19230.1 Ferritin-like domain-containing protein [Hymenobacter arizonensis]
MSDNLQPRGSDETTLDQPLYTPIKRRSFFMYAGATAGATALVLAGCSKDSDNNPNDAALIDVGSSDVGVLNYAYALEQLEAAFYAQVLTGAYFTGAPAAEKAILTDISIHEKIHADFFKTAITAAAPTQIIKALEVDFSSIDFSNRTRVLEAAKLFEDTGVAAYNGAGRYLTNDTYLTLAGKIVSVEARHAALIRDLISNGTFADNTVLDANALEMSKTPQQVATAVNTYLRNGSKISATRLV